MDEYDCIIIGAGPAGITAAIYLARAQIKCLVLGKWKSGNLYRAHIVGNYPGFPDDVSGPYIVENFVKQAKRFGAEFIEEDVISVKKNGEKDFSIEIDNKDEFKAKTIILCLGKAYKMSNVKNEKELTGKGVSYCVICDGFFFKNKKVAVIGSKSLAAGEAIHLLDYTKDVTMLTNGRDLEANEILLKDLEKNKINTIKDKVVAFEGDKKLEYVVFDNGKKERFDGVFIALGTTTALNFANSLGLEMDDTNIKIDRNGKTSIDGVWAAGDCTGCNQQAVSSAGEGCNASVSVIKYLKGKKVYVDYD